MIFGKQLTQQILRERKTATRRPCRFTASTSGTVPVPCRYKPGHTYAVQPGRGKPAIARIRITAVEQQRAGDLTLADARREGFRTRDDFKQAWVRIHDRAWVDKHKVDLADCLGLSVVAFILCKRFDEQHADTPVWAITFELAKDEPRYLATQLDILEGRTDDGEYTTQRERSIDDAECVDQVTETRYAREAREFAEQQRARFLAALEQERAQRKAERGRSFRDAA